MKKVTMQNVKLIQEILSDTDFHYGMALAVKKLVDDASKKLNVDKEVIVTVCAQEVFNESVDNRFGENTHNNPLISPLWTVVLNAYDNLPQISSAFDKFKTADVSIAEKR